jgi:hypothetical protein
LDNWSNWGKVVTGQFEATRPYVSSEYVNPRALDWLMDHRQPGRLGRVTLDFAEDEAVHGIVLRNFDQFKE